MNRLPGLSIPGLELPVIQAPMAGVQDSALALAAGPGRPWNVNFFAHTPPLPDLEREAAWRKRLAPYYREFGIDPAAIPAGPGCQPFDARAAELVEHFRLAVVLLSVHFPGPVHVAFLMAQAIKPSHPGVVTVLGGGYANAELRELKELRVFDFHGTDVITLLYRLGSGYEVR